MADFTYIAKYISLDNPIDVIVNPDLNQIAITDSGNDRVVVLDLQGMELEMESSDMDTSSSHTYNTPAGICYYNGQYFIADTGRHVVIRINARDLSYIQYFGIYGTSGTDNSHLNQPKGICTDGKYLYVIDSGNNRIVKLTIKNMDYVSESTYPMSSPTGISYGNNEKALYVTDTANHRVLKFDADFNLEDSTGSNGSGDGEFNFPYYCAVNDDFLFIADGLNNRIQVLTTAELTYTTENGSSGTGDDDYGVPCGMALFGDVLFVTELTNDRLKVQYNYDPIRALLPSSTAKAGGVFWEGETAIIIDSDELIVGATDEYGSPNRWVEETNQADSIAFSAESEISIENGSIIGSNFLISNDLTVGATRSGKFDEESSISSTWTEET